MRQGGRSDQQVVGVDELTAIGQSGKTLGVNAGNLGIKIQDRQPCKYGFNIDQMPHSPFSLPLVVDTNQQLGDGHGADIDVTVRSHGAKIDVPAGALLC